MRESNRSHKLSALILGASLCLGAVSFTGSAFAQGANLESATAEQKSTAQKAFIAGAKAAEKGDHEAALASFRESYGAVASPNSHLMVARELVALNRLEEAYVEFDNTIPEAEAAAKVDAKYEQAATAAQKERDDLAAKLALLTLNVSGTAPGDVVKVRGKEIPQSDWSKPLPVMPGMVRVELVQASGKETVKEINAEAGSAPTIDLAPEVAAPPPPPKDEGTKVSTDSSKWDMRTWSYVAGGVGAAGIVTFGVFGLLNNSKHSKLEDECKNGVCPSSLESDKNTGQTYQTVANVGLVVGIVGLGTGTALYLLSDKKKEKSALSTVPRVDIGPRSVSVSGTF
ncbi:MAG: hypothetical protein KC776_04265 [Myxococcales bacterium]|nr:hypothetical protein [Myxococcales bacterium]MCB9580045.1 hypothetical protein [Polyangiaceae bacterium]